MNLTTIDATGTLLAQVKGRSIEISSLYNPYYLTRYSYIEEAHERTIRSVYLLPDYKGLLTGDKEGLIKRWSLQGEIKKIYEGHKDSINDLTSIGEFLISASSDKTIKIWDIDNGVIVKTLVSYDEEPYSITINKNYLVSGSIDINIWNIQEGLVSFTLKGHSSSITRLVLKGRYLASASLDYTIKLWDIEERRLVNTYGPMKDIARELIFHPDSYDLFIGCDNSSNIILWDPLDDRVSLILNGYSTCNSSLVIRDVYNSDTEQLVSASMDGKVKVWSIYTGMLINDEYFNNDSEDS